jgi:hypothetical protein
MCQQPARALLIVATLICWKFTKEFLALLVRPLIDAPAPLFFQQCRRRGDVAGDASRYREPLGYRRWAINRDFSQYTQRIYCHYHHKVGITKQSIKLRIAVL